MPLPILIAFLLSSLYQEQESTEEWKPAYERALQERGERVPDLAYPFNQEVNRQGNRSRREFLRTQELVEQIRVLDIPALIIQGERDIRPFWPAQQVADLLLQARFHVIPDAEHSLWLTHPEPLQSLLRGFLQEVVPPLAASIQKE